MILRKFEHHLYIFQCQKKQLYFWHSEIVHIPMIPNVECGQQGG